MIRRGSRLVRLLIVAVFGSLLLTCAGFLLPLDVFGNLLVGWAFFLRRTLPAVSIGAEGIATGLICLVGFVVGLHLFLRWFVAAMPKAASSDEHSGPRWRWRWTAQVVGLVVLLFASGVAATGIAHQAGWLLTSPEPMAEGSMGSRWAAHRAQSTNNLRQIGLGLLVYSQDQGTFPPGGIFDTTGRGLHGWQVEILPYLELSGGLYSDIAPTLPWDDPANASALATEVRFFLRPETELRVDPFGRALSHYAGNVHVLGGDAPLSQERITDGLSNTILVGEAAGNFKPWGHHANWRDPKLGINRTPDGFGSPSPGGASFLMADGSVRFIKDTIDPSVFEALGTPAGGEPISMEDF